MLMLVTMFFVVVVVVVVFVVWPLYFLVPFFCFVFWMQCCSTNYVSPPYIVRKMDKNIVITDATEPVSQLQKVAFQLVISDRGCDDIMMVLWWAWWRCWEADCARCLLAFRSVIPFFPPFPADAGTCRNPICLSTKTMLWPWGLVISKKGGVIRKKGERKKRKKKKSLPSVLSFMNKWIHPSFISCFSASC